jgi:glycosyltransferase involved in cell wall biosynthesis
LQLRISHTMRIGFTTYPVAFQRPGGLEVQIRETAEALRAIGADVRIVELYSEKLSDFDIIHHFSLKHSSHRILQYAHGLGVPVVASPLADSSISPIQVHAINLARRSIHKLFGSTFSGAWDDLETALKLCAHVFPLTERERKVLEEFCPSVRGRSTVVGNGVADSFFSADSAEFHRHFHTKPPILFLPSSIEPLKNQLKVIHAARALGLTIALAGPILDSAYWERCRSVGGTSILYLGALPAKSELLLAAFAAADCVALLSEYEAFGLVPFEALAAGTPALLTTNSGVDRPSSPPWFQRVDPRDTQAITTALATALSAHRDRDACRSFVADMRWGNAASLLLREYEAVLAG